MWSKLLFHFRYKFWNPINYKILWPLAIKFSWFAPFYYAIFSNAFRRENQSVLAGRLAYHNNKFRSQGNEFLLRRNIHRLEKGLIMKPRKPVFALDYIQQTVDTFCTMYSKTTLENPLLKWANDVLEMYFEVTENKGKLIQLKQNFEAKKKTIDQALYNPEPSIRYIPYVRSVINPINYQDFLQLSIRRRSVRWFQQKEVPTELIEQALQVALYAPSACNRQPFVYRIFNDPLLAKKIGAIPMGTQGFSSNFPALAVIIGRLDAYETEKDRHVIYIDAALSAMSFMYALETLGLSSCPINWPDIEEKEKAMDQALHLHPYERPVMLIAFGYPDEEGMVPYSCKKPIKEITQFNY